MPRTPASAAGFPSVTGVPDRLRPPADLGEAERRVFLELVGNSRPEAFKASDLPLLCAYCRAVTIEIEAAQELASGNDKALPKWNGAIKAVVSLSQRLRLSPQSRAANNPTRPGSKTERPLSYYDWQALQEADHDGSA